MATALPLAAHLAEHDVEHVHRLRVATRRAIAALKLYRDWLPRKPARWLKKRLKKIRRAAGDARDLDVLAERLAREYGERAAPVVELIAERRAHVQPAIVEVAERCRRDDRFVRKDEQAAGRSQVAEVERRVSRAELSRVGRQRSLPTRRTFFDALPGDTADTAALHQFRIRGKALRYTIELVVAGVRAGLAKGALSGRRGAAGTARRRSGSCHGAWHISCEWADDSRRDAEQQVLLRELAEEEREQLDRRGRRLPKLVDRTSGPQALRTGLTQATESRRGYGSPCKLLTKRNRHLDRLRQPAQILDPRNLHRTQAGRVRRQLLDVEQLVAAGTQMGDQVRERDFRGVAHAVEHAFRGKQPADGNAVRAADELPLWKATISAPHPGSPGERPSQHCVRGRARASGNRPRSSRREPRAALAVAGRRAAADHAVEIAVARHLELAAAKRAPQSARNVETVEFNDRPRIGRPPGDRLVLPHRPGEDAVRVGVQQPFGRQPAADAQAGLPASWRSAAERIAARDRPMSSGSGRYSTSAGRYSVSDSSGSRAMRRA